MSILERCGVKWDYRVLRASLLITRSKPMMTVVIFPTSSGAVDWSLAEMLGFQQPHPYLPNMEPQPPMIRNLVPRVSHGQQLLWRGDFWRVQQRVKGGGEWLIEQMIDDESQFGICGEAGCVALTLSILGFQSAAEVA